MCAAATRDALPPPARRTAFFHAGAPCAEWPRDVAALVLVSLMTKPPSDEHVEQFMVEP